MPCIPILSTAVLTILVREIYAFRQTKFAGAVGSTKLLGPYSQKEIDALQPEIKSGIASGIFDVDGRQLEPQKIWHSYMRIVGRKSQLRLEMQGPIRVAPDDSHLLGRDHAVFKANADFGEAVSFINGHVSLSRSWAIVPMTFKQFFQRLQDHMLAVSKEFNELYPERGRNLSSPWDPTYYNCQHFLRDALRVIEKPAKKGFEWRLSSNFYQSAIMHDTAVLGMLQANHVTKVVSDVGNWFERFGLDCPPTCGLLEWQKIGIRDDTIEKIEIYWRDATWAGQVLTSPESRHRDDLNRLIGLQTWFGAHMNYIKHEPTTQSI